jgi:hypothetical protein
MLIDITLDEVDGKIDLIDVIHREMQVHLGEKTYIYTSEKLLAALINELCRQFWDDKKTYEEMADLAEARLNKINELEDEIRTLREENTILRLGGELSI